MRRADPHDIARKIVAVLGGACAPPVDSSGARVIISGVDFEALTPAKRFPVESNRYRVDTIDRSQDPDREDHGHFRSVESAAGFVAREIGVHNADEVIIVDTIKRVAILRKVYT